MRAPVKSSRAQHGDQIRIDLECGQSRAAFEQRERQRTRSRPDLERLRVRRYTVERESRNLPRGAGVLKEVLPVALLRTQSGASEQTSGSGYLSV